MAATPCAKPPACGASSNQAGGWTNDFIKEESGALVVHSSLTFSKACSPLLGGHPPAIHPVPAAGPADTPAVHNLVRTVNLILARLRSCGVLANQCAAQSQRSFQQIGLDQNTFSAASQDCLPPYTITQTALEAFLQQPQNAAAATAPVLRRVLQLWQAIPGSQAQQPIDAITFQRLYLQALQEQQSATAAAAPL